MTEDSADLDLVARLKRLEDERDIRQLMDLVWLLADAGPVESFAELYTEDCVIDLGRLVSPDVDTVIEGIAAVRARYSGSNHASRPGRSHHLAAGPQAILIDGDEAQAITYALNSALVDGTAKTVVIGFNFWRLARGPRGWRVRSRISRRLGDGDVLALFGPIVRRLLDDLSPG